MAFETKYLGSIIYDWFLDLDSDEWITKVLLLLQREWATERANKFRSHQPSPDCDETMKIELPIPEAAQELVK